MPVVYSFSFAKSIHFIGSWKIFQVTDMTTRRPIFEKNIFDSSNIFQSQVYLYILYTEIVFDRYIIRIVPKSNDMHIFNFITLCKAIRTQTKSDFHPQADFIIHISSLSWGWNGNSFTLDNKQINTYTIRFTTLTAVKYIMTFSSFSLLFSHWSH